MMGKQGWAARAVSSLRQAVGFLQHAAMSSLPHTPSASLAFGVAITAVVGLVVATTLGGTLLFSLCSRKRKRSPLTAKQWCAAFDAVSGRLVNQQKVLEKIRFGGIEPSIRTEVWPFLLGFYELDNTREERESVKRCKREMYIALKLRCNALRANVSETASECDNTNGSTEVSFEGSSLSPDEKKIAAPASDDLSFAGNSSIEDSEDHPKKGLTELAFAPPIVKDGMAALATDNDLFACNTIEENAEAKELPRTECASVLSEVAHADLKKDCFKATDKFINCQRIIRVDAVRMNAEWVPYSPTQANVTEEIAFELAKSVGLRDDEHLEPCRQHHAARLVAILEAYALHDPETGYCQGMSDLLSPFVALLDEDYEAFWCFVQFMATARDNFRTDEVGIRWQLNKISSIFRAGDPRLYSHLESTYTENCFFVYRMVVVFMRRELTFEQTISLWEVIWAEKRAMRLSHTKWAGWKARWKTFVTEDLILFVIAAAVRQRRKVIIEKCRGLGDILRECNSMAGHLDVWKLLNDAREMACKVRGRLADK